MSKKLGIVFIVIFNILYSSTVARSEEADLLYVFGLYEGIHEKKKRKQPHWAAINLNGLTARATLVLTSAYPINWEITSPKSSLIKSVILGGSSSAKTTVRINGEQYTDVVRRGDIPYAYKQSGIKFRNIIKTLQGQLGFKKIDGFMGSYRVPKEGFFLSLMKKASSHFDANYLDNSIAKVEDLPKVVFKSNIRNEVAMYNLNGQKIRPAKILNSQKIINIPNYDAKFEITNNGFFRTDIASGKESYILLPEGEYFGGSPISLFGARPKGLAFDQKQSRLLGVWNKNWTESFLLQYDLISNRWINFKRLPYIDPTSLSYDVIEDRFVISYINISKRELGVAIIDVNGKLVHNKAFKAANFPGYTDLYDVGNSWPVELFIAYAKENWVVLSASEEPYRRNDESPRVPQRLYLYDVKTGNIQLTYYEGMQVED